MEDKTISLVEGYRGDGGAREEMNGVGRDRSQIGVTGKGKDEG